MIELLLRSRRYLVLAIGLVAFSLIFLILEELATQHQTINPQPSPIAHVTQMIHINSNHVNHSASSNVNSSLHVDKVSLNASKSDPSSIKSPGGTSDSSFWKFELIMALTAGASYYLCKRREEIICSRVMERINRQLACGV